MSKSKTAFDANKLFKCVVHVLNALLLHFFFIYLKKKAEKDHYYYNLSAVFQSVPTAID